MKKLGVSLTLATFATLAPVALLHAQPAPPAPPAPPAAPLAGHMRSLLDPAESFGAIYGTRNLARQPDAVVPLHDPSAQHTLKLNSEDLLQAQNARRQPPAALGAFMTYLHADPLLTQMMQAGGAEAAALVVLAWNHVALDMTSIDHTTAGVPGVFEPTYAEQFGPPRSARAMAMVHLAMFEAANTIDPRFKSYTPPGAPATLGTTILAALPPGTAHPTAKDASLAAAISQAAYDTLVSLYPKKKALLDASKLTIGIAVAAQETAEPGNAAARLTLGDQVGASAAAAVIAARQDDGSSFNAMQQTCAPGGALPVPLCWESFFPTPIPVPANPAEWTSDEIAPNRLMLGANWSKVTPFVLTPGEFITDAGLQLPGGLRPVPVAADLQGNLAKGGYGAMIPDPHGGPGHIFNKYGVHNFGGFGATPGSPVTFPPGQGKRALTTTARTADQTTWGEFWGYDATALLCAPPRLYNMVATSYLLQHMPPSDWPPARRNRPLPRPRQHRHVRRRRRRLGRQVQIPHRPPRHLHPQLRRRQRGRLALDPARPGRLQRRRHQRNPPVPRLALRPRRLRRRPVHDGRQGHRRQQGHQPVRLRLRRVQRQHHRRRRPHPPLGQRPLHLARRRRMGKRRKPHLARHPLATRRRRRLRPRRRHRRSRLHPDLAAANPVAPTFPGQYPTLAGQPLTV